MSRHWLALLRAGGVGPVTGRALLSKAGTAEALFEGGHGLWRAAGASEAVCASLAQPDWASVDRDLAWLAKGEHRHFITCDHAAYPRRLRELPDAPLALFVEGDLDCLSLPQIAVVGSRNPTPIGAETAQEFAAFLARNGLVVTSGLALGIDAAAHEGALSAQRLTIAVVGTGLDQVYPAKHKQLANRVAASGALVSEFPIGVPARPEHFPRRNRIISGLAQGVLVVEAALKSGSLITAQQAMEQGREVFAIPGSIHNPLARGCHRLIRDGAKLVESGADILEEVGHLLTQSFEQGTSAVDNAQPSSPLHEMDGDYGLLLAAFGDAPTHTDTLVERSGLTVEVVSSMLLIMELQGQVVAVPGGAYQRRR